jgi:hypothetical protein
MFANKGETLPPCGEPSSTTKIADVRVNGKVTELKNLDPGATSGTVGNSVNSSIKGEGQARDLIVNSQGSGLTKAEAERGLARVAGIQNGKSDSVRIIGDGFDVTRKY